MLADQLRHRTVGSKVTESEYAKLAALAEQEGRRLGEWVRVALLERSVKEFGRKEFRRLERWLRRVGNWGACDALCCSLLGPMVAADPGALWRAVGWARSKNYWHRRAAAEAITAEAMQQVLTRADAEKQQKARKRLKEMQQTQAGGEVER